MPAPKRGDKFSGDITWNDVGEAEQEYATHYSCRIEWRAAWIRYHAKSDRKYLTVYCEAVSGREGPARLIGVGQCGFRNGRGAATVPAAYLRSMIDACGDLEERRRNPRYARDTPVCPPWEE